MTRYPDHSKLLEYRDDEATVHPVRTCADWEKRRADILAGIEEVMGPLPTDRPDLDAQFTDPIERDGYERYRVSYQADKGARVPAYLLVPSVLQGRAPGILCLHQTTAIGKGEPVGLGGRPTLRYAHELAKRGYVCLAPDYPSFGDYDYDFTTDDYVSGSMKAIWNNIRAVDLLGEHADVDAERIGCIGHSLGGHNTIFTAVFERRIKAVVSSCGYTAFGRYYGGNLKGWSSERYMPRITSYGGWQNVPFDFHELIAALAPRPFLSVAPLGDSNFDNQGVREVLASARAVYELCDAGERLVARFPDSGHDFPDADRAAAYAFFDRWLRQA